MPGLSQSGYRFMGGSVVATAHGAAVLYMYDNDHGTRLVMLTRLMAIDGNTPMKQSAEGSVVGFTWAGQDVGYSLVKRVGKSNRRPNCTPRASVYGQAPRAQPLSERGLDRAILAITGALACSCWQRHAKSTGNEHPNRADLIGARIVRG